MNTDKIRDHIRKLIKSGELNGEIIEICDSEERGEDIKFVIEDKKYSIGYAYITEDDDDWAQAECYEVSWCNCDDKHMDSKKLYEIVENRKLIERESKLKSLGL
jgi:hypothetical protein